MSGFLLACGVSALVVFVAELGDKSQLMALAFATRYRALPVLVGITVATSVVHLLSVAVGHGLGAALPTGWISLTAAVMFLGFGLWTLRGDSLNESEQAKAARVAGSALLAVTVAFFLAELGDKTMLATITLATQHGWAGVWVGSTVGMVAADALAIVVGRRLGRRLPEKAVRVGAAALFFLGGAWLAVGASGDLPGFDHHVAGWVALVLGVAAVALGVLGRGPRPAGRAGRTAAAWWARSLFALAAVLGLAAPLLVGIDVIDPIALFDDPGVAVIGAGLSLLGTVLVLAARSQVAAVRRSGPALATDGLHERVRHPGLTGGVLALAGTLVMVPTLVGVLATVVLVVAVQVQVRGVREPALARVHGEAYTAYAARTGRFLPRVRTTEPATPPGLPGGHARVG
ncbi:TMEM165/GDT1 family protein [Pseudonocardia broussonetiae]|uniref:TMEM165/GDT1 family protein n=1 Tax=Pseudonocardia broussonetiae TaxID=2736640 RepID=A0A6M6J9W0_9PSEU|nr:TMEM165/GDT1 family protein [Pseudonocardia broussonetiae]QJY44644.1 TMEM165/GDT1 family protein [Pseudonocardia broussonetiae]